MTPADAAWVRAHVWTPRMRESYREVPAIYETCACQWGPCGHCEAQRHDLCEQHADTRPESPATYVVTRGGSVAVLDGLRRTVCAVFEVGHRHSWACPCLSEHAPRVVQDDLLSLLDAS